MAGHKGKVRPKEVKEKIRLGMKKYHADYKLMREFYLQHNKEKLKEEGEK